MINIHTHTQTHTHIYIHTHIYTYIQGWKKVSRSDLQFFGNYRKIANHFLN